MKQFLFFVYIICLLGQTSIAQGLQPSTVRQIFALEKGDSLEYHEWTSQLAPGCAWIVCDHYKFKVVDTTYYNTTWDSLYIRFSNVLIHYDTAVQPGSCGRCQQSFVVDDPFSIDLTQWVITELDTSIERYIDTIYHSGGGSVVYIADTSYSDPAKYLGAKQNQVVIGYMIMDGTMDIYSDSLGITYKTEDYQLGYHNNEELIYYHKANGATWGQRYVYTGLEEVRRSAMSIYPNPATGHMTIQADSYQDMTYELYDILGQKIATGLLQATETNVDVKPLTPGIYLCHLLYAGRSVRSLKLIID